MHPRNAYIDICFHTVRADQVIGPDRGGQAIAVGINQRQQFLFAVERSDVAARAKDFFAHDRGGFGQVSPDSRLNPGACCQFPGHIRHSATRHQNYRSFTIGMKLV